MGLPPHWRIQEIFGAGLASRTAPVIIGGCGSSGTTLLRRMLDRHPDIYCGPESTLFLSRISSSDELGERFGFEPVEIARWKRQSRSRTEFIERFQAACLARSGKRVWADKTPENLRWFPAIRRRFPEARLVHAIRDGRDVACSLRRARWISLEKITGGADRASPEAFEACIRYWAERVRFGRALAADPLYFEVCYEDLLRDPEATLRNLLGFLDLEWRPDVLRACEDPAAPSAGPLFHSSVGRWREELSAAEGEIALSHAGDLLVDLGYARDRHWVRALPPGPHGSEPPPARAPVSPETRPANGLKDLRRDALAAWFAIRDGRLPKRAWALGVLAGFYLALPFDLIPDRIPVFGYLDDAVALLLVGALIRRLVPAELVRELRHAAALHLSRRTWALGRGPVRA